MSRIGYIRVSTEHQETARQQEIMCDYQVDRIFSEKISGANKDRPQLKAMLDYVREGDTLYIESISRLGRSTNVNIICIHFRNAPAVAVFVWELFKLLYVVFVFHNRSPQKNNKNLSSQEKYGIIEER